MTEDEYFATLPVYKQNSHFSKPLYECPECGKMSVCRNESICLTTYPPQYQYRCLKEYGGCGEYWRTYH